MLTDLPWQAVSIIAANTGQADCVSLAIACPSLIPLIATRLYQSIVIDLGPRRVPQYIEFEEISGYGPQAITLVRTSAGLRRCLQVLSKHPEWASKVKSLRARSNLPLSDFNMRQLLTGAFTNLCSLVQLEWRACPELPTDVLNLLPRKQLLRELNADLALRSSEKFPDMQFDSLRTLNIRPFLGPAGLRWLSKVVRESTALEELVLCRFLDDKREVGSSYAFVGQSDVSRSRQNVRLISEFFGVFGPDKLPLKRLELVQFLHDNDASLLLGCMETQGIHTLGLSGVDATGSNCLLERLEYKTPALKTLKLDWNAPAAKVVAYLDHLEVDTLEISVYAGPLEVLSAVSRQRKLKNLRVNIHCRFAAADFEPLRECKGLVFLAMPFNFQTRTWPHVHSLETLEHLELVYSGEKNQRNGNNTLVSCGLLSMWNDEYAYPLQYTGLIGELRPHKSLRLVDIDGHSHTLKPNSTGKAR